MKIVKLENGRYEVEEKGIKYTVTRETTEPFYKPYKDTDWYIETLKNGKLTIVGMTKTFKAAKKLIKQRDPKWSDK